MRPPTTFQQFLAARQMAASAAGFLARQGTPAGPPPFVPLTPAQGNYPDPTAAEFHHGPSVNALPFEAWPRQAITPANAHQFMPAPAPAPAAPARPRPPLPLTAQPAFAPVPAVPPPPVVVPAQTAVPVGTSGAALTTDPRIDARRAELTAASFPDPTAATWTRPHPEGTRPPVYEPGQATYQDPRIDASQAQVERDWLPAVEDDRDQKRRAAEAAWYESAAINAFAAGDHAATETAVTQMLVLTLGRDPEQVEVDAAFDAAARAAQDPAQAQAARERRDAAAAAYYEADAGVVYLGGESGGDVSADPLGTLWGWLDEPRQAAATQLGGLAHSVATGTPVGDAAGAMTPLFNLIGGADSSGDLIQWAEDNPDLVRGLHANGYDADADGYVDFTGDRAVWEYWIGTQPTYARALFDLAIDPLNYLEGLGLVGKGMRAAGAARAANATTRGGRWIGQAQEATGAALQVPTTLLDKPVDAAIGGALGAARAIPGIGNLVKPTRTAATREATGQVGDAATDVIGRAPSAGGATPTGVATPPPGRPGMPPAPANIPPPNVLPPQQPGLSPAPASAPLPAPPPAQAPGRLPAPAPAAAAPTPAAGTTPSPAVVPAATPGGLPVRRVPRQDGLEGYVVGRPGGRTLVVREAGGGTWVVLDDQGARVGSASSRESAFAIADQAVAPGPPPLRTSDDGRVRLANEGGRFVVRLDGEEVGHGASRAAGDRFYDEVAADPDGYGRPTPPEPQPPVPGAGALPAPEVPAPDAVAASVPSWVAKPPATTKEIERAPWTVRPTRKDGTPHPVFGPLSRRPEAWRAVLSEVGDEAEVLAREFDRMHPVEAALAEGRYRVAVNAAVERHAPEVVPAAQAAIRQSGQAGKAKKVLTRKVERLLLEPWSATGDDLRQLLAHPEGTPPVLERADWNRGGTAIRNAGDVLSNAEASRRFVELVDLHAALVPADAGTPAFQVAVRQAEETRRVLHENGVDLAPSPDPPVFDPEQIPESVQVNSLRQAFTPEPQPEAVADVADGASSPAPPSAAALLEPPRWPYEPQAASEWFEVWDEAKRAATLDEANAVFARVKQEDMAGLPWQERGQAARQVGTQKANFARAWARVRGDAPPGARPGSGPNIPGEILTYLTQPVTPQAAPTPNVNDAPVETWRGRVVTRHESDVLSRRLRHNGERAGDFVSRELDRLTARGAPEAEVLPGILGDLMKKELESAGIDNKLAAGMLKLWDGLTVPLSLMTRLNAATGLRYVFTQFLGNPVTLTLARHPEAALRALNPKTFRQTFRYLRDEDDLPGYVLRVQERTGLKVPDAVLQLARDEYGVATDRARQGVLDRVGLGWASPLEAGLKAALAPQVLQDAAKAADLNARLSLWAIEAERRLPEAFGRLADNAAERARRLPGSPLDAGQLRALVDGVANAPAQSPSRLLTAPSGRPPNRADAVRAAVRDFAKRSGMDEAAAAVFAERVGRDFLDAGRGASRGAADEVRRVLFGAPETNADAILRRLFFFHYWNSRASVLYAKELIRSPGVLNAYVKGIAELKERAEEEGSPPWLRSWLKVADSAFGMSIFLNPYALISTAFLFADEGDDRSAWNPLKYLYLNPAIDMALYVVGVDGLREKLTGKDSGAPPALPGVGALSRVFTAGVNLGRAYLGDGTDVLYDPAREVLPGAREAVTDEPQPNPNATAESTFNTFVIDAGRAMGYTDAQIAAAMDDSSDPAYREAYRNYAAANAGTEAWRSTVPVPIATRGETRDDLMAENRGSTAGTANPFGAAGDAAYRAAFGTPMPQGYDPYEGAVTAQDMAFLRAYKAATATGTWLGPADVETAWGQREADNLLYDAANAGSPEARVLGMEDAAYDALGTEQGRYAQRMWGNIAYDPMPFAVVVGGRRYAEEDIDAYRDAQVALVGEEGADELAQEFRYLLADAWLAEAGLTEERDALRAEREAFVAANPTYAGYDAWSRAVRKHEGGVEGWWADVAPFNPNAAAFYEEAVSEGLEGDALERRLMSRAGYLAVSGERVQVFDPDPLPSNTAPYGLPGPGGAAAAPASGGGGNPTLDRAVDIAGDLAEYEAGKALGATLLPGPEWQPFGPWGEQMQANAYAKAGYDPPVLDGLAREYVEWSATVPPNGDASILAFLAARDAGKASTEAAALPWLLAGGGADAAARIAPDLAATGSQGGYGAFRVSRGGGSTGTRVRR